MSQMTEVLHVTESLCPVCLKKIEAKHVLENEDIYLKKTCDEHGDFSSIIWRGEHKPDYFSWKKNKVWSHPKKCLSEVEKGCPFDCGLCSDHRQDTCCVLLEVTERCNLKCSFCFADSGKTAPDPSFGMIKWWLKHLVEMGRPFIHLSGGEPTVRDDLPEIIAMAKEMGFPYIQLNTNGMRLAEDLEYVKTLKEAGLSSVFMQFDGTKDEIYRKLRGRDLLEEKTQAIKNCADHDLGVVLVPTLVPGVNADQIGEIINFGLVRIPHVRGVHFQPVSYFGRYPEMPLDSQRITLPEVIREIEGQTGGLFKIEYFASSGCDHSRCGFHGDFLMMPDGTVQSLTPQNDQACCCGSKDMNTSAVEKNRSFVARRWVKNSTNNQNQAGSNDVADDFDCFIQLVKSRSFTITAMAFQDCWNIDLERVRECSLHVLNPDGKIIPFCAYNLSSSQGKNLYRGNGGHKS